MKCVRLVGQGVPTRLSNTEAAAIVREHDGEYCPKSFYRDWWTRARNYANVQTGMTEFADRNYGRVEHA